MVDIKEVAENVYMIDNQVYSISNYGSTYLLDEEKKAIIDPGPATSVETIMSGVREVGVRPEEVDYLIVTHIHLDHAGGAGVLIKDLPKAQVVVHYRGARHLADPTKLTESATEAQGEEVISEFGEVMPIEKHQIKSVYEGDIIELSAGQTLRFVEAPGHAPHEICIYENRSNGLFTGDAVGLYIEDIILLPATAPPKFDLELWLDTIKKLKEIDASKFYFSHFGVSDKPQETLQLAIDKLQTWDEIVTRTVKDSRFDSAAMEMANHTLTELEPIKENKPLYEYLTKQDVPLSIKGYLKYYQEKRLN